MLIGNIHRLSTTVDKIVSWATVLLTAGFSCLIFTSVLSRYFFDFTILFSQEVSKLLFIWACFFAATITYKRNAHIRFEFIDRFLSPSVLKLSDLTIHTLSFIFFLVIFFKSISYVSQIWETYFPLIGISQGWLYVSVIIASGVFLIHNLSFLIDTILRPSFSIKSASHSNDEGGQC